MRALSLPGCGCRGAFQIAVLARLSARGERFDLVAGASSGSISGAVYVAGLAADGPEYFRQMSATPIMSGRYLKTEKSPFGMSRILREALERFVPEAQITTSDVELLVSTTRARRLLSSVLSEWRESEMTALRDVPKRVRGLFRRPNALDLHERLKRDGVLAIHSSRSRADMHDVIVASCTIPGVYARLPVLDGEVHVDGGAADNTLLGALLERGATDITVVTPYLEGAVSPTLFERERTPIVPRGVRLRLIWPERPIALGRFDFHQGRLEEALAMPHVEKVIEP